MSVLLSDILTFLGFQKNKCNIIGYKGIPTAGKVRETQVLHKVRFTLGFQMDRRAAVGFLGKQGSARIINVAIFLSSQTGAKGNPGELVNLQEA
jgi:hypothetical protein